MAEYIRIKYRTKQSRAVSVTTVVGVAKSNIYQCVDGTTESTTVIQSTSKYPFFIMDVETSATASDLTSTYLTRDYLVKVYELIGASGTPTNPVIDEDMLNKYNTLNDSNYTNLTISNKWSYTISENYRNNLSLRWGYYTLAGHVITDIECLSTQCCFTLTTRAQEFLNNYHQRNQLGFFFKPSRCVTWAQLGFVGQSSARYSFPLFDTLVHGKDFHYFDPTTLVDTDYGRCYPAWITLQSDFAINNFERFSNGTTIRIPDISDEYNIPYGVQEIDHVYNAWQGAGTTVVETTNRLTAFHTILADNLTTPLEYTRSKWNYFRYLTNKEYTLDCTMDLDNRKIDVGCIVSAQICGGKELLEPSKSYDEDTGIQLSINPMYRLRVQTFKRLDNEYLLVGQSTSNLTKAKDVNVLTLQLADSIKGDTEYKNLFIDELPDNEQFYNFVSLELIKQYSTVSASGKTSVSNEIYYRSGELVSRSNISIEEFEELKQTNLMYIFTIGIEHTPDYINDYNTDSTTPYENGRLLMQFRKKTIPPIEPIDPEKPEEPSDPIKYPPKPVPPDPVTGKIPEPIPPTPPQPTNKLTRVDSLYKIYKMSLLEINALSSFLWNEDWVDLLKPLQTNPMENIISLKRSCFDIPASDRVNVYIGNVNTEVEGSPIYEHYSETIGSFTLKGKYNTFLDFSPFSQYYIYLPFIGKKELDPNLCLNKSLTISVVVDSATLLARYVIKNSDNVIIAEYEFNSGMDLPISATDATQKAISIGTNLIGTGAKVIGNAMIGNIGGAVAEGVNGLVSSTMTQVSTTTEGRPSANTSLLCDRSVYLEIHRPSYQYISSYAHTKGYPAYVTQAVSSLNGFNVFSPDIDLSGISTTSNEMEQLKSLLTSGIYI